MKDELEALDAIINDKSIELFGITERHTDYYFIPADACAGSRSEWEAHFTFIEEEWDEEGAFWSFWGIDVSDGHGRQLGCMYAFGRQLICALKRLHPDAVLNLPGQSLTTEQLEKLAEEWGRRLTQ